MARTPKLEEYTLTLGGVEHTVQLTPEDAEAQGAKKGRASVDRSPTVPSSATYAVTESPEFQAAVDAAVAKVLEDVATTPAPATTK